MSGDKIPLSHSSKRCRYKIIARNRKRRRKMELPLINEKQRTTDVYHNLDDSERHAEQKMPDTQRVQFSLSDILGKVRLQGQEVYQFLPTTGAGGPDCQCVNGTLWDGKKYSVSQKSHGVCICLNHGHMGVYICQNSLNWTLKMSTCNEYVSISMYAKSLPSCLTLCDPIDSSPPGSPVPGILQARTLEWVAISSSNAWNWKWKWSRSVVPDS